VNKSLSGLRREEVQIAEKNARTRTNAVPFWKRKAADDDNERQSVRREAYDEITINDAARNGEAVHFHDNVISTTKYNRYTFVFKNLYEQFRRVTNVREKDGERRHSRSIQPFI
jgi:hypothetical protein